MDLKTPAPRPSLARAVTRAARRGPVLAWLMTILPISAVAFFAGGLFERAGRPYPPTAADLVQRVAALRHPASGTGDTEVAPRSLPNNDPLLPIKVHKAGLVEPGRVALKIANTHFQPVEILGIQCSGPLFATDEPPTLPPKQAGQPLRFTAVDLPRPTDCGGDTVRDDRLLVVAGWQLDYRISGTERVRSAPVEAFPESTTDVTVRDAAPAITLPSWTEPDPESREIRIPPGEWRLTTRWTIPAGYTVRCGPGTTLWLEDGAAIVSYSPLAFAGTASQPIRLASEGGGQGLAVLETAGRSTLRHVSFENLAAPRMGSLELTGAVTFYEADVDLADCAFSANRAEDGLNIVRGDFSSRDVRFSGAPSDAFDVDFCTGTITRVTLLDSGNDALDLSGSHVELSAVTIRGAGDKGLSVGEESQVSGKGLTVEGAASVAMASKDLSELRLEGVVVRNAAIALAVYQKKPHFGPGKAWIDRLELSEVSERNLVEEGSTLVVDGQDVPAVAVGVVERLYPPEEPGP